MSVNYCARGAFAQMKYILFPNPVYAIILEPGEHTHIENRTMHALCPGMKEERGEEVIFKFNVQATRSW